MLTIILDTAVPSGDWTSLLTQGGAVGILAAGVVAFVRGWIVPGSAYKEVCGQRDRAIDQVYRLADNAVRTAEVTQRAVDVVERRSAP